MPALYMPGRVGPSAFSIRTTPVTRPALPILATLLNLSLVTDSAPPLDRNDYFADPYAYFARLRQSRPVTPVDLPGMGRAWLITQYEEVRAALADPRLAKDPRKMYPDWEPD